MARSKEDSQGFQFELRMAWQGPARTGPMLSKFFARSPPLACGLAALAPDFAPKLCVTSGSRNKISLKFKNAISNRTFQNGRPGRYRKLKRNTKKTTKHAHPQARERTPRHRSFPEITAVPAPSEDVLANSRTRKTAQQMTKLRSLHILHVSPRKSKTL